MKPLVASKLFGFYSNRGKAYRNTVTFDSKKRKVERYGHYVHRLGEILGFAKHCCVSKMSICIEKRPLKDPLFPLTS